MEYNNRMARYGNRMAKTAYHQSERPEYPKTPKQTLSKPKSEGRDGTNEKRA